MRNPCAPGLKGQTDDRRCARRLGPHPPLLARGAAYAGLVQVGRPALHRTVFRRNHLRLSPTRPSTCSSGALFLSTPSLIGRSEARPYRRPVSSSTCPGAARPWRRGCWRPFPATLCCPRPTPSTPCCGRLCANPSVAEADRIGSGSEPSSALSASGGAATRRTCISNLRAGISLILPLIREAFPGTPWIFLYRDPLEVLVSQARLRGRTMSPGLLTPRFLGLDLATAMRMAPDEYCARFLARICQRRWTTRATAGCSSITGNCRRRSAPSSGTFSDARPASRGGRDAPNSPLQRQDPATGFHGRQRREAPARHGPDPGRSRSNGCSLSTAGWKNGGR